MDSAVNMNRESLKYCIFSGLSESSVRSISCSCTARILFCLVSVLMSVTLYISPFTSQCESGMEAGLLELSIQMQGIMVWCCLEFKFGDYG